MISQTGLAEDLAHLRDKYLLGSSFMDNLLTSPKSARSQIQLYRTNMYAVCILPILFGIAFVAFAIARYEIWTGLMAGIIGSIIIVCFFRLLLNKMTTLREIIQIASYHELI